MNGFIIHYTLSCRCKYWPLLFDDAILRVLQVDSLVGRLSLFPFTQFPGNVENKPVAQIAVVVGSEFVQVAVEHLAARCLEIPDKWVVPQQRYLPAFVGIGGGE
mgnify:CR=1 FL=1